MPRAPVTSACAAAQDVRALAASWVPQRALLRDIVAHLEEVHRAAGARMAAAGLANPNNLRACGRALHVCMHAFLWQ